MGARRGVSPDFEPDADRLAAAADHRVALDLREPLGAAAALALQRSAGNRATVEAVTRGLASRPPARRVARCQGRCTCGGACGSSHVDELVAGIPEQLRRAVAGRSARSSSAGRVVLAEVPLVPSGDPAPARGVATGLLLQRDVAPASGGEPAAATPPAGQPDRPPVADQSRQTDQSTIGPGAPVDERQARAIVADFIATLGPLGATTVPFPSDLVAANETAHAGEQAVQTWPIGKRLMRAPAGAFQFEAGFVGALQLCYDLCTGDLSVNGWIWAGGGVVAKGLFGGESWWGAYVFAEKEFGKWHLDFMPRLSCGTCDPDCEQGEGGVGNGFEAGIGGFPVVLKPGERKELKQAGVEVGALLTPDPNHCGADLELGVLIDLPKYLGPVGAAVKSAEDLLNKWAKEAGEEISCGVGVVISGTLHLCKSVPGGGIAGITADSALLCGGGFVGCALGLAHDKASLPGGGH